jgi:transposase InsO family protein
LFIKEKEAIKVGLAFVLDLFARRIVGWALSDSPDADLTIKALDHAYELRGKPEGGIGRRSLASFSNPLQGHNTCIRKTRYHGLGGILGINRRPTTGGEPREDQSKEVYEFYLHRLVGK